MRLAVTFFSLFMLLCLGCTDVHKVEFIPHVQAPQNTPVFLDLCINASQSDSLIDDKIRHTIQVLLQKSGENGISEDACQKSNDILLKVESLDLNDKGLSDLRPLASFVNLRSLTLSNNKDLDDASPLATLTQLRHLDISHTSVKFMHFASNLSQLEKLILSHTKVLHFDPLENLVSLTHLEYEGYTYRDLTLISKLKNLSFLSLKSSSDLSTIYGIEHLTQLEHLDLSECDGLDPSMNRLVHLNHLKHLNLSNTVLDHMVHYVSGEYSTLPSFYEGVPLPFFGFWAFKFEWQDNISGVYGRADRNMFHFTSLPLIPELEALDLSGRALKNSRVLIHFKKLKTLNVSYNFFHEFPIELFVIDTLETLEINSNVWFRDPPLKPGFDTLVRELPPPSIAQLETLKNRSSNLRNLSLVRNGLRDISFLQYFTKLRNLNLGINKIEDLSPLSKLSNLQALNLTHNPTKSIEPLSGLKNLTHLSINNNNIKDFSPLGELTNLKTLSANGCGNELRRVLKDYSDFSDISPLATLINLESLTIDKNRIGDISPLANLTKLKYLSMHNNKFSDLSPLKNLIHLRMLNMDSNQISNLDGLDNLTHLETLSIAENEIVNITPLKNMKQLTNLIAYKNKIEDLAPLKNLGYFDKLLLSGTFSDLSYLNSLKGIRKLGFYDSEQVNWNSLAEAKVTDLQIIESNINDGDLEQLLPFLKTLRRLDLIGESIERIDVLKQLIQLEVLDISVNPISKKSLQNTLKDTEILETDPPDYLVI